MVSYAILLVQGSLAAFATATPAIEADRFVASTAVATHWRFNNVYQSYAALSDKLIDSGLRIGRDTGTGSDFVAKVQKLSDAGVKSILTIHPASGSRPNSSYWANSPARNVDAFVTQFGRDVVNYVEMNNELDGPSQQAATYWHTTSEPLSADSSSPYYYVSYVQAATADTWTQLAASSDPSVINLPLIGPSLTTDSAYSLVGDLGAVIEFSNVHHYLYGWNPEVTNIRSIDHAITYQAEVQNPGGGRIATEGGGATAASLSSNWPLVAHGRYMPRYYLAHFLKGFSVTTAYELVDQGTDSAVQEQNFGLLKNDLSEKPAYTALKNLWSVLSDPGPDFSPGSLDFTLSGSVTNVWSALFQKRNGDYYLCLWLGVSCFNPTTSTTLVVPAQSVSVALPPTIVSAQSFTVDDTGAMSSGAVTISGNSITLDVTDRVTIVRLSPLGSGGAASAPTGLRAAPDNGSITLKWAPVGEATSYTVRCAATVGGPYSVVVSGLTTTSYTHSGLTNGSIGYYTVTATSGGGESAATRPLGVVPFAPLLVDNADSNAVRTGTWTTSTSTAGYYGTNFLHDGNTGSTGGKKVTFTPTVATAGDYDVYVRWAANTNRATNTPVDIVASDGPHSLTFNQKLNSNVWVLAGTFHFNTGTSGSVVIRNDGADGYVIADAVRFELTRPRPPTGLAVTVGSSSFDLTWNAVTGGGTYSVKRAVAGGSYLVIASGLTSTSYSDTSITPGTVYHYAVSCTHAGGESSDSAPVTSN